MKIANKFLYTFFLVCLLFSFASAELVVIQTPYEEPAFSTFSSPDISSCACTPVTDYVVITNPLSTPQAFRVASNNAYVVLPTSDLVVGAKSSLSVPYQINTPCSVKSDSFEIVVFGSHETKKILKNLNVLQCQNLQIENIGDQIVTDICEPFTSTFIIENSGAFKESYEVIPRTYEDFVSFPSQIITLDAKESAQVSFPYHFSCDMVGKFDLDYDIFTAKSDLSAHISQEVLIADSYNYSVQIQAADNICIGDEEIFQIIIENKNNFTDFFKVDVDAPSYVDVKYPIFEGKSTQSIALAPHTKTSIDAVVSPSMKKDAAYEELSVIVTSKFAQSTQKATTNFAVNNCYDFDNVFTSSFDSMSVCGGEILTRDVELTHKGSASPLIGLSSSPDYVYFENDSIQFNGSQIQNTTLIFDIPHNITSKEQVVLSAWFRNETVDTSSFNLFVDTKENCYLISPIKHEVSIYENTDSFNLVVQNLGERASSFTSDLLFTPEYLSLVTKEFELNPGRRTKLAFKINQTELQLAAQNKNTSVVGLSGLYSLRLAPHNNFTQYDYTINLRVVEYPWYLKLWNVFISFPICLIIFVILALLVVIFGILGIIKTSRHNHFYSNNLLALILAIIFVIAAIFVIINVGVPQNPYTVHDLDSNSTTYIRLAEDNAKSIPIDYFFFDPDNNIVDFSIGNVDADVISITKANDSFTIVPKADWNGITSIMLNVTDAYNESAMSPEIVLEVLPVEDYSFYDFFMLFCEYFNLVVLFVLFVVIYVAFSFHPRPKEKQLTIEEAKEKETPKEEVAKKSSKKSTTKKSTKKATKSVSSKKTTKKSRKKISKKSASKK